MRPITLIGVIACFAALPIACGSPASDSSTSFDAGTTSSSPSPDAADDAAADAANDARTEPPVITPHGEITVETIAGSATAGDVDGVGAAAEFDNPVGLVIDSDGQLLVTEYDGGRLRKVPVTGAATSTLVSGLESPFALVPTEDAIYVQTDRDVNGDKGPDSGTIWKLLRTGGAPEVFVSGLGRPRGLARLHDGRVVVSDRMRNTISILDLETKSLTLLAGSGSPGFVNDRGAAASFNVPYGVAVLPDDSILVAESANHVIRRVTLDGDVTTFAGEGVRGMKDDADKMKARFDGPSDVAVDAAGNAFVSDGGNHRIRRISSAGVVDTVAGTGSRGFADGVGASAMFYGQEQLDVTADGKTIYVADGNGGDGESYHRIRRIHVP